MSTEEIKIAKLEEGLALAKKHHADAEERLKETRNEVLKAEVALQNALNPEFALTSSD